MSDSQQPPLMGFHWNEAERIESLDKGLLTIIAHDLNRTPHIIGTGFIVDSDGLKATCITAAHIFSEVRRLQNPHQKSHRSTLPEFAPSPKKIDIDRKNFRAISFDGERVESAVIEGLTFDETTDIAIFSIALQHSTSKPFFFNHFLINDIPPTIDNLVCVLSYANQSVLNHECHGEQASFGMERRLVLRVGRILNYYPNGHRLCRGSCIETSIPVYSGMSGSPVFYYDDTNGTEIKVFGLVCCDPDEDDEQKEQKQDRSVEGHSIFATIPCQINVDKDGKKRAKITLHPQENNTTGWGH